MRAAALWLAAALLLAAAPAWAVSSISLVAIGDSIGAGYGLSAGENFPTYFALYAPRTASLALNDSTAGETCATHVTNIATDEAALVGGDVNVAVIECGLNDLAQGASAATTASRIATLCADMHGAGFTVALLTLSRAGSVSDTLVDGTNALIVSQYRSWSCDVLVNMSADPHYGEAATLTDTTWYQSDHVHPTDLGQHWWAGYVAGAVGTWLSNFATGVIP